MAYNKCQGVWTDVENKLAEDVENYGDDVGGLEFEAGEVGEGEEVCGWCAGWERDG